RSADNRPMGPRRLRAPRVGPVAQGRRDDGSAHSSRREVIGARRPLRARSSPNLTGGRMSYEAEISRSNPSAFLFLIDMSGSMTDPYAGGKRKADGVADAINKLLSNLSIKCTKSEGVRDY